MSDEYKKLYSSLEVLGAAIKKAEDHLRKSPSAHELYIDITEDFLKFHPENHENARYTLRFAYSDGYVDEQLMNDVDLLADLSIFLANDPDLPINSIGSYLWDLSECPSDEKIAYAKYIPELISLANKKILDLAATAEDYAGEIEQALAMAAKKPERKPKKKS